MLISKEIYKEEDTQLRRKSEDKLFDLFSAAVSENITKVTFQTKQA